MRPYVRSGSHYRFDPKLQWVAERSCSQCRGLGIDPGSDLHRLSDPPVVVTVSIQVGDDVALRYTTQCIAKQRTPPHDEVWACITVTRVASKSSRTANLVEKYEDLRDGASLGEVLRRWIKDGALMTSDDLRRFQFRGKRAHCVDDHALWQQAMAIELRL